MSTEYIKDGRGQKIGALTENAGQTTLYDMSSRRLGVYNHAMNATFNANGQKIGQGDQLMRLLFG